MKHLYYSSWNDFVRTTSGIIFICIFGLYINGFSKNTLIGAAAFVLVEIYLFWEHYNIHVEIVDDRQLINSGQSDWGSYNVDISSILYVGRAQQYVWRTGQSRLIIFGRDTSGKLKQTSLQEFHYNMQTIRALLLDLLKINPRIKLDEQYKKLVEESNIDYATFKSIPAKRTVAEVEQYASHMTL